MADSRKLEKTSVPGIYRRHAYGCKHRKGCKCPYVVRWKERGCPHKQFFGTFELAREFKGSLDSGRVSRRPQSSETIASYYERWLPNYTGRTARGLDESTRKGYELSFRLHILPRAIGRLRIREAAAPDIRDWLRELERLGAGPSTIIKAKIALSVMLACAVEDGDIPFNPTTGVRYVPSDQARRRHPPRKRRPLTGADVKAILLAMPEQWRAFFTLLVQSGVRISELLGLTWANVHLGDDPHIMLVEQFYRGKRKKLKTEASKARVPISSSMATWLAELRPANADSQTPVFASTTGTPLSYHNVYHRVLQPALIDAGLAIKIGENAKGKPIYDYQGIAFHAFRKACGSLLLANGKTLKQVQGWLRHSQLTTTMNVYIHQVDDGLGSANAWDEILGDTRGHPGATRGPDPGTKDDEEHPSKSASQSQSNDQPQTAANPRSAS